MKVIILVKQNNKGVVRSLFYWRSKFLLEHTISSILRFKAPHELWFIGPNKPEIYEILSKFRIPKQNYTIHINGGTSVEYLLEVETKISESPDEFFYVFDADVYVTKKELRKIFMLELLKKPFICIHNYRIPYASIHKNMHDNTVLGINEYPTIYVDTGIYIIPKNIFSIINKYDGISESLFWLSKSNKIERIEDYTRIETHEVVEWKHFRRQADLFLEDDEDKLYNSAMDQRKSD
jgi:hypothetical protein